MKPVGWPPAILISGTLSRSSTPSSGDSTAHCPTPSDSSALYQMHPARPKCCEEYDLRSRQIKGVAPARSCSAILRAQTEAGILEKN